ncbi:MAG: hypothetical protein OHK0053_34380 [Microscillaceae bacterium]
MMVKMWRNKKNLPWLGLGLWLSLAGLLSTCSPETPDPCANAERVKASFKVGQNIFVRNTETETPFLLDTLVASDTVLTGSVIFTAEDLGAGVSYEWQVGNPQNTISQRQFLLVFQEPVANIPVRLIVRRPNSPCFADGTDADTLVKYLTVIDRDANPILGTYEGYLLSQPNEIFEVRILRDDLVNSYIININRGCNPGLFVYGGFVYKQLFFFLDFYTAFGCLTPRGWAVLEENNPDKVRISFQSRAYAAAEAPFVADVFLGTRK